MGFLQPGCSRVEALKQAKKLGCVVKPKRRTGEATVSHRLWRRRVTLNNRRKDAPRHLTTRLNKLARNLEGVDRQAKRRKKSNARIGRPTSQTIHVRHSNHVKGAPQ